MRNAKNNSIRHRVSNKKYYYFLLIFTMAFLPTSLIAQPTPQPMPGFECYFENPDGGNVYPCASVVTAHISIPSGITNVTLIFPNSFQFIAVTPGTTNGPSLPFPGFIYGTASIPTGALVSKEFVPGIGVSSIWVELQY
jgi:hypothetical protein